jgi:hypothetical protein
MLTSPVLPDVVSTPSTRLDTNHGSSLLIDMYGEPSQPVGTRRKYNKAALAPCVPSAYVVLDERAVTQKRVDPGPLAPACHLRPEISPRFHAGSV